MSELRHFTKEDIRKKIPMREAIILMKEAFRQLSSGGATVPVRTVIETQDQTGQAFFMPSYSSGYGLFGLKMVSVFGNNGEKNLPIIQGRMLVMEALTGSPLAILDAEYLTALRTGAASGLATDLLARKNADVLALFGAGVQAETQLEGVLAVRQIKETLVFGRTREKANAFCDRMREKFKIEIRSATNDELRHADIICAATTSATPVFESSQIKKGVHINGIGSFKPSMQEIPSTTIAQSTLIVDQKKAVLIEAGDVVIPIQLGIINENHIHAELGQIISGLKKGRTADGQVTVFKSVGNAIQDLALAHFLLRS